MQTVVAPLPGLTVRRHGVIMKPQPGDPAESAGVFNPGAARGRDGNLYLFPRLTQARTSRIGIARVLFDSVGDPVGVQRLGIALDPSADYELNPGGGGCEDARVTWVEPLQLFVMTYTAVGAHGPRIALAVSEDIVHWDRLGLVWFQPDDLPSFNVINKDAVFFPVALNDPRGVPSVVLVHRPLFPGTEAHSTARLPRPRLVDLSRESMWVSYSPLEAIRCNRGLLCHFVSHHRLAAPVASWERLKIGAGTPPILMKDGFLLVYHGVSADANGAHIYSAGMLILDARDGKTILFRSREPIFKPETNDELEGRAPHVVFPTGIDCRRDIGRPNRFDVYYGMADYQVGVVSLELSEELELASLRDPYNLLV